MSSLKMFLRIALVVAVLPFGVCAGPEPPRRVPANSSRAASHLVTVAGCKRGLPHTDEDDAGGPEARHGPHALGGHPRDTRPVTACADAAAGSVADDGRGDQHGVRGSLGA